MPQESGLRTLVVCDARTTLPAECRNATLVRTPLDLVQALDRPFERVVLAGRFAREECYVAFVRQARPAADVVRAERLDTLSLQPVWFA